MRRSLILALALLAPAAASAQVPCSVREDLVTVDSVAVTVVQALPPSSIGAYVAFPEDGRVIVQGNTVYFVTKARSFTIKFQALTSRTDATAPTFTFTWP